MNLNSKSIIDRLEIAMSDKGINQARLSQMQGKNKSAYNSFKKRVLRKTELTEVDLIEVLKDPFLNRACQDLGVDRYYIVYNKEPDNQPNTNQTEDKMETGLIFKELTAIRQELREIKEILAEGKKNQKAV